MKIGILTLHSGANYGGTLQCLALYKILQAMGHEAEVIDYIPKKVAPLYRRVLYNLTCCRDLKDVRTFIKKRKLDTRSHHKNLSSELVQVFDEFRGKWIKFSPLLTDEDISYVNDRYDCIVVGSDQVWSSFLREPLVYFGEWAPQYKGNLISYAACSFSYKYPLIRKWKLKRLLDRFQHISVRDCVTQTLVKEISNRNATVVLDPTFMYDFSCLDIHKQVLSYPYILTYVLGKETAVGNKSVLEGIRNQYGEHCKVVAVTNYAEDVSYADVTIHNANPEQWIRLIHNALFLFTDSFHGCVFAIKACVPFLGYYEEENRASRLLELKETFSLDNRIQKGDSIVLVSTLFEKCDFLSKPGYSKFYSDSLKYIDKI